MSVFGITVVGSQGCGKTALCSRIVSRHFDPRKKSTEEPVKYYVRSENLKEDCLVMLEDTPGVELIGSKSLFRCAWWFELWDEEKLMGGDDSDDESAPLVKKKAKQAQLNAGSKKNPIYSEQKRFGVVVVFDLASAESFTQAGTLIDDLFARAQAFNPQGWKMAPLAVLLVGNKCDLIGKQREVSQEDIDTILKTWTNEILVDRKTKEPRKHISYFEISAKHGTNCDLVIPTMLENIRKLPTRRAVLTPDLGDGLYGSLLREYEWARAFHGYREDVGEVAGRWRRKAKRKLGPVFKGKWFFDLIDPIKKNTYDKVPEVPIPVRFKVFPRWMICCLCFVKPPPEESDDESEEEDDEDEDE